MKKLLVVICSAVLAFGLAGCIGKGSSAWQGKGPGGADPRLAFKTFEAPTKKRVAALHHRCGP